MDSAILIGNGLNRCYEEKISWSNLLKVIEEKYEVKLNDSNSFSLEFESLINQILYKMDNPNDKIYDEIKKMIAEEVTKQKPEKGSLHELFVKDIGINHILTTNYDYMLEQVIDANYSKEKYSNENTETKYSIKRRTKIDNTFFYHIHGEANYPRTICLGYEHYAGYLAKMRENKGKICEELQSNYQFVEKDPQMWLNIFFTHDIYIVGFSLDFCEIDIWWLLTYRAYLFYSNVENMKNYIKNKIKIYIVYNPEDYKDKNKLILLNNLHVEYKEVKCEIVEKEPDYLNAYKKIASYIKNDIRIF